MVNLSLIFCFHRMFRYPKSFLWKAVIGRPSAELMRRRCRGKRPRAAGPRHSGLAGDSAARGEDAWLSGPAPRHAVPAWLASHLQDCGSEERGGARVAGGRRGVGTKGHGAAGQGRPPPRTGSLFRPRCSGQGACPQGPSLGSGRVARQMGPAAEGNSLPPRGRTRPPPAHSSGAFHRRGREADRAPRA